MTTKKILTSDSHPLKVDFVADLPTQGKLGMTFAPGKFQENTPTGNNWHRDVATDVRVLRETHGIEVLVSLLEDFEYTQLQIEHLFATCREHGIEVIHFPIVDGETPVSLEDTHAVVSKMQAHLEAGRNVVRMRADAFELLGLDPSDVLDAAKKEAVNRRYRAISPFLHPDKANMRNGTLFSLMVEARDFLLNPDTNFNLLVNFQGMSDGESEDS
ncbi:DnaJ domain containing protein [Acanthamoeba castellanii str. Neff]|uniref:DnaJ domain containing protein n=1 Tax=Acanthamoeba castellanii (strain ATCC 30010 / Neff) TaxID=1257118 RepID=L8H7S6_ACACF|nr:DnaJ domain containing protein [Acanthamoeba castellanii str. Neff]ELR21185.1 DnaJ domain containing protein [Acanthamoeba castellanii str. Neff]